jgi:hypothetical protein
MTFINVRAYRLRADHYSIDMLWPFLWHKAAAWIAEISSPDELGNLAQIDGAVAIW